MLLSRNTSIGSSAQTSPIIFEAPTSMFDSLFGSYEVQRTWELKPKKYPAGSSHHYSSKVLLPYMVLRELAQDNINPPYLFEIANNNGYQRTACSVLDFIETNDEEVLVPSWLYEQLDLNDTESVKLKFITVKKGTGIKLRPHSCDFLEVENPRSELERVLRYYPVLTYGDEILLKITDIGDCRFTISDVIPDTEDSIYIVDVDLNVEFDEPEDYKLRMEEEKTVMKYVEINKENKDMSKIQMKRLGLFLDWDQLI